MNEELEDQFAMTKLYLTEDSPQLYTFQEMYKLIKMFYEYLEKNKP